MRRILHGGARAAAAGSPVISFIAMLTVALIFGGRSAEHEISLASARFVAENLDTAEHRIVPVGILPDGAWVMPADLSAALRNGLAAVPCEPVALSVEPGRPHLDTAGGQRIPIDFVFPILHGTYGEDGTIQGMLEMAALPYAGAGVLGSAVGMDKELMKAAFAAAGLPQVKYLTLRDCAGEVPAAVGRVEAGFDYPVFVKPANLGSSVGMTKAHDRGELVAALELAFRYDRKVLVEAFAAGRELECAVLGNESPAASVPGEVIPAKEFYDYEAKYTDGMMEFRIPAPLTPGQRAQVQDLAVRAFLAIDCAGFARCDFFLTDESRVLVNEINTIPGMTSMSAFPLLWKAAGVGHRELVDRIIRLGLARHATRTALATSR
jgi:D-alanine-D-alanine ligase